MAQAEQLKQQTLATLSERDHQLRQLTAMLEKAHGQRPKLQQEHYQRQVKQLFWSSQTGEKSICCTELMISPEKPKEKGHPR